MIPRKKNENAMFMSFAEAAQALGLGICKTRELAKESGSIIKIGKQITRVDVQKLKDYISAEYGTD